MDSVFHALRLAAQTREIQCYLPQSEAKLALATSKMAFRLATVPNEEISQINKEVVPDNKIMCALDSYKNLAIKQINYLECGLCMLQAPCGT